MMSFFSTKKKHPTCLFSLTTPSHLFITGTFRPRKGRIFHVPRVKNSNKGQEMIFKFMSICHKPPAVEKNFETTLYRTL